MGDSSVEELVSASQMNSNHHYPRRPQNHQNNDNSLFDSDDDDGGDGFGEDFATLYGDDGDIEEKSERGGGGGFGADGEEGDEEEEEESDDEDDGGLTVSRKHTDRMDEAEEDNGEDLDGSDEMEEDEDDADPQAKVITAMKTAKEAFNNLKAISKNGKVLGTYVQLSPVDFDQAFSRLCPDDNSKDEVINSSGARKSKKRNYSQAYDMSFDARSDLSESVDESSGTGKTPSDRTSEDEEYSDEGNNDTGDIMGLLSNYNIPINPTIKKALDAIKNTQNHKEGGEPRPKKRRRKEDTQDMTTEQIDAFVREKFSEDIKYAGLNFDDFMNITCPLCAFGNQAGDPIYAPKLNFIKTIVNEGIMRGHLETTIFMVVLFWNRYIVIPMVKRGRRIMRLTYKMAMNHLTEPHIPDPRIDVRLDIQLLNRMAKASRNMMFYHNSFTGALQCDSKTFKDTLAAIRTKHAIRKNKLESQAFFSPNMDFGEQTAANFTNPYMQVHFGAKEPPRSQIVSNKPQGNRSAGKWRGWRNGKD